MMNVWGMWCDKCSCAGILWWREAERSLVMDEKFSVWENWEDGVEHLIEQHVDWTLLWSSFWRSMDNIVCNLVMRLLKQKNLRFHETTATTAIVKVVAAHSLVKSVRLSICFFWCWACQSSQTCCIHYMLICIAPLEYSIPICMQNQSCPLN